MAKLLAAALMFGISASDAGKSKIVFIGDSYAAGVGAGEYRVTVAGLFKSGCPAVEAISFGEGGSTARNWAARTGATSAAARLEGVNADMAWVSVGGNDFIGSNCNARVLPAVTTSIVTLLASIDIPVLMLGYPSLANGKLTTLASGCNSPTLIADLNSAIESACASSADTCTYVDSTAALGGSDSEFSDESLFADTLHPNAAGYAFLFRQQGVKDWAGCNTITTTPPFLPSLFSTITSGTCTSNGLVDIPDLAACEAAATSLVLSAADASRQTTASKPPGCYLNNRKGRLKFNEASSRKEATSSLRSICVGAPTTTMAYAEITSGTCTSNRLVGISDLAACETAATFLVLSAADASRQTTASKPPGCYLNNIKGHLKFNEASSRKEATSSLRSICVGAPTTTMAYAEITSGTCPSNGLVDIPNLAACEAAAIVLVLGAADASRQITTSKPPGCYLNNRKGHLKFNEASSRKEATSSLRSICVGAM